jgi:predicted PurR-regulated permease PerM
VVGFTIILGLGALLVVTAAAQVTTLVHNLPAYSHEVQHLEPQIVRVLRPFGVTDAKFHTAEQHVTSYLQSIGTSIAADSLDIVTTILGAIIDVVLVLILSVYLTANGTRIARGLQQQTPTRQRRHTALLINIVNQVVGGYVRGQLTLAALIGVLVGLGMVVLHVRYAVLLGILAFFMEFIPVIGVLISGAVCVIVALFQGWILALVVLGYFVFVHVIEGDVVGPRIMAHAVGIHPATALVALVAGTELFGVWGALLAAPLAGLLQAIFVAAWREIRGGNAQVILHAVEQEVTQEANEEAKTTEGAAP